MRPVLPSAVKVKASLGEAAVEAAVEAVAVEPAAAGVVVAEAHRSCAVSRRTRLPYDYRKHCPIFCVTAHKRKGYPYARTAT